jgi:hypothetical protein
MASKKQIKLYWVTSADHDEDWFIFAESAKEARTYHEHYEGYGKGERHHRHAAGRNRRIPAGQAVEPDSSGLADRVHSIDQRYHPAARGVAGGDGTTAPAGCPPGSAAGGQRRAPNIAHHGHYGRGRCGQQAYMELLDLVAQSLPKDTPSGAGHFSWVRPNRVVFSDRWQVQARFVQEPGRCSVFFERFGAEMGHVNYEPIPGTGKPKQTVVTMIPDLHGREAFWRLSDGQTLKTDVLARRLIERLLSFHDDYGMSIIAPGL